MAKFKWTTEGTRPTMTVVSWPITAVLLMIIGTAVLVTCLLTSRVSQQEKDFEAKQLEYETSLLEKTHKNK